MWREQGGAKSREGVPQEPGGIRGSRLSTYTIFVWHGFFLALTRTTLDPNTVFPALVSSLVDSKTFFGVLYAIMLGGPFAFNVVFGHFLHGKPRKKPYLLLGIYLRALSFLGMALFTLFFATRAPLLVAASLVGWILLFSLSGGFAGVSYADLVATLTPRGTRGHLYATKQLAASVAMLLGGVVVVGALGFTSLAYPVNYAAVLGIGSAGLVVASLGFWFIREEPHRGGDEAPETLRAFLRRVPAIVGKDRRFLRFIISSNMASFSLMLLPFYMIFARDMLHVGTEWVGRYLLLQVAGAIASNLIWGYLSGRRGSGAVVRTCIVIGGAIPLLALALGPLGPGAFGLVFVLVGFVMSGRSVGFEPYLLDLAPEDQRTVYVGINGTLNFTRALLPILGGALMDLFGFTAAFLVTAGAMGGSLLVLGSTSDPTAAR
ncbi:MAG: MFS transporter [Gemmatimonadetes bacterium]|nr:MFS transporter [Gemmatimonadota bacterium]